MSEEERSISVQIRKDVAHAWGDNTEKILKACQSHLLDAMSTQLTLHQRFHCMSCLHPSLMTDFFHWLNEEGYTYVIEDFDYPEFVSHVVRWGIGWCDERLLSPCTDGMPSAEVH